MGTRYQFVVQSKDGEEVFGETNNLKTKNIKEDERLLSYAIVKGRRLIVYIKDWDEEDNEAYELRDIETIKYY